IAFPREAGAAYQGFAKTVGADCLALDTKVDLEWAAKVLQTDGCVQGNLDPKLLVEGGARLASETKRIVKALSGGPHIFNLGHGITPDADPENVHIMLETIRGS
ncbi:MAG TPA: uroporphyrinogen decarboxylase, partial [Rhodobacteraceae bacterium]|nr:uroporphyrinogen decarboxylase [Paracoccaceae bacterium]